MLSILNNVFSSRKTNIACASVNSTFLAINLFRLFAHLNTKRKINNNIYEVNQIIGEHNNLIDEHNNLIAATNYRPKLSNILLAYNSYTNPIHKNNIKFFCFMGVQALGCLGSVITILPYFNKNMNNPNIKLAATILNVISTTCLTFAMIPTRTLLQNNFEVYSEDHGRMMLYSYDIFLPIRHPENIDQNTRIYYNDAAQQVMFKPESIDNNVTYTPVNIYKDRNDSNRFCFVFNSNEYFFDKLCSITQNYKYNAIAVQPGRG